MFHPVHQLASNPHALVVWMDSDKLHINLVFLQQATHRFKGTKQRTGSQQLQGINPQTPKDLLTAGLSLKSLYKAEAQQELKEPQHPT